MKICRNSSIGRATDLSLKLMNSKSKGNTTELQAIASFVAEGYNVSIPFGEDCRYDFIVDINHILIRVQAKSSRSKNPSNFEFHCQRSQTNRKRVKQVLYSKDEIDYFCTMWNNICYLVPVGECSADKRLWFKAPSNNQAKGVCYAKDYTLEVQIPKILEKHSKTNQ